MTSIIQSTGTLIIKTGGRSELGNTRVYYWKLPSGDVTVEMTPHLAKYDFAYCPAIVILQLQLKLFDIINWKKDKEQDCLDGGDKIVQHVFCCLFIESQPGCWTRPVSHPISCREKPSPLAVSTLLIRFLKFQDFWFCKVVSAMVRVK